MRADGMVATSRETIQRLERSGSRTMRHVVATDYAPLAEATNGIDHRLRAEYAVVVRQYSSDIVCAGKGAAAGHHDRRKRADQPHPGARP